MFLTRLIYKLFAFIELHASRQDLALGICFGMLLGLSPINTLHFWCFFSLLFFIRLNIGTTVASFSVFYLISYLGNTFFASVGESLLTRKELLSLWTFLYESPLIPFTNFYVPSVLGKLVCGILMAPPLFLAAKKIIAYLEAIIYHWWRTTKFYNVYRAYKPYAR